MLEIKQLTRLQIIRYCEKLEKENKTLKDNVEFLHSCLDDRDKSIEIMKEENRNLKNELMEDMKTESKLNEEIRNLKSELSKFRDSFKKYRDYEKEELAESCYDLARENEKLKEMYNVYVTGTLKLKEENKKLKNKIKNGKIIRGIISDCIMLAFLCLMCSGCLCMLFQMITDVIMGFQFIRWM